MLWQILKYFIFPAFLIGRKVSFRKPIFAIFSFSILKRKGWDIYQLMNETNLSRRNLLVYLRILEVAGFLTSIKEGRKKIYVPTNISTNLCGS
jgi:predicted transcriptional regulator